MIDARSFVERAMQAGFQVYSGVPCTYLKPLINFVLDSRGVRYVAATNEGDAIAVASGAELGGKHAVAMFQNSGLGNAVNPLSSLNAIYRIPVLLVVTLRGEPGGPHDEPQHAMMGDITGRLLDLLRIPWEWFPRSEDDVAGVFERAVTHMTREATPYALVMKKDSVAPYAQVARAQVRDIPPPLDPPRDGRQPLPSRLEVLRLVQARALASDAIITTTGYAGRELYALEDRASQLYLVGSMGCATGVALGVALARPRKRVVVLDGDGAALMRMGALAMLGYERPPNLLHVLLDNEAYESTGGQSTVSHSMDLAAVARACGYPRVVRAGSLEPLERELARPSGELTMVHVKIRTGVIPDLPRPKPTPEDVGARFRAWLGSES